MSWTVGPNFNKQWRSFVEHQQTLHRIHGLQRTGVAKCPRFFEPSLKFLVFFFISNKYFFKRCDLQIPKPWDVYQTLIQNTTMSWLVVSFVSTPRKHDWVKVSWDKMTFPIQYNMYIYIYIYIYTCTYVIRYVVPMEKWKCSRPPTTVRILVFTVISSNTSNNACIRAIYSNS